MKTRIVVLPLLALLLLSACTWGSSDGARDSAGDSVTVGGTTTGGDAESDVRRLVIDVKSHAGDTAYVSERVTEVIRDYEEHFVDRIPEFRTQMQDVMAGDTAFARAVEPDYSLWNANHKEL